MKTRFISCIALFLSLALTTHAQTEITTVEELSAINTDAASLKGRYKLMNDLTLENWIPIGTAGQPFAGTFDGNGHTITITSIGQAPSAPFNLKSGIEIPATETSYIGVFGFNGRRSIIQNLRVEGVIDYTSENKNIMLGGITGANYGTIQSCVSEIQILVRDQGTSGYYFTGGLIGVNNGIVRNNYSTGNITVEGGKTKYAGGIAGLNDFDAGIIQWCYATVDLSVSGGTGENYAGGIAGLCARGGLVQYCVALNENILSDQSESNFTGRYVGLNQGRMGNNFSRHDIVLTDDKANLKGRDLIDLIVLQETEWWTVNRHIRFAFGDNISKPWAWNNEDKRPVLYWETNAVPPGEAETASDGITEIRSAEELAAINLTPGRLKGNYILMNDIEVENWTPIGHVRSFFNGTFDGNGYTIMIKNINPEILSTSRPFVYNPFKMGGSPLQTAVVQTFFVGLFGAIGNEGVVKNLKVSGKIIFDSGQKDNIAGGIAGENYGKILNCASIVDIKATGGFFNKKLKTWTAFSGGCFAGGITGVNNGHITNCYASSSINISGKATRCAGGISGSNGYQHFGPKGQIESEQGVIKNCYTTGTLFIDGDGASKYMGGITGFLAGLNMPNNEKSLIENCVALNEIIKVEGDVENSYRKMDGINQIAGENEGRIVNSYACENMKFEGCEITQKKADIKRTILNEQLLEKNWWTGSPDKFEYLFGTDENAPWVWNEELKRPVLYWETNAL